MSKKELWIATMIFVAVFYGFLSMLSGESSSKKERFASYGEVITVYNSDGQLIGVMWTPDKETSLDYVLGKDGVPRFVARRKAKRSDVLEPAAFDDTVRQ